MAVRIGFIGYGEVGTTFACDLIANGAGPVAAWDIRPERLLRAEADGVRAAVSDADSMADADVVISAVTADQVEAVAACAARALAPGQIFLDVNSASPATKTRAAAVVEATGAAYVEGAVMAPVAAPRLKVPILGGGPGAERAAALLNPLGMNIRPVSREHGRASAMKLCRSIMIKGLEALIVDCAAASKAWGVEDEVWRSLSETFPSVDWPALAGTMAGRVRQHGVRRAAEMREAAQMLGDLGMAEGLCLAVADAQQRGAKS
jgi:3-hydroxyisobutyrate dehydrogenase-like beta-hydroxyacid dehydrogenase